MGPSSDDRRLRHHARRRPRPRPVKPLRLVQHPAPEQVRHHSRHSTRREQGRPGGACQYQRCGDREFSRRNAARRGFDYSTPRSLRPDIIIVSMPAFGNTGPWRDFIQYGIGQEQLGGISSMNGCLDQHDPVKSGVRCVGPVPLWASTTPSFSGIFWGCQQRRYRSCKRTELQARSQHTNLML